MVVTMNTRPEDREDAMYEARFHMSSSEDAAVSMSQCANINVYIGDNQDEKEDGAEDAAEAKEQDPDMSKVDEMRRRAVWNGDGDDSTGQESEIDIVYGATDADDGAGVGDAVEDEEEGKIEILPEVDTEQGLQKQRERGHEY